MNIKERTKIENQGATEEEEKEQEQEEIEQEEEQETLRNEEEDEQEWKLRHIVTTQEATRGILVTSSTRKERIFKKNMFSKTPKHSN